MGRCGEFDENSLKRNTGILKTGIPIYNQYIYIYHYIPIPQNGLPRVYVVGVVANGTSYQVVFMELSFGFHEWSTPFC